MWSAAHPQNSSNERVAPASPTASDESHGSQGAAERSAAATSGDQAAGVVASIVHVEPTSTVAEPTWPSPPQVPPREWERFERYPNYLAAQIVAGLLESEGVPTLVESIGAFPGGASFSTIWVPIELAHRARWILAWPPPSEAELTFLATGELTLEDQRS
jgi:hypothetical protein